MNLAEIMDAVANKLVVEGVVKLAYAWPVESPGQTPAVVVEYPNSMELDVTFGSPSHHLEMAVWVVVGKVYGKNTRDNLSKYLEHAAGIKQVLDGDLDGTVQSCRVTDAQITTLITPSGGDYMGIRFDLDIYT